MSQINYMPLCHFMPIHNYAYLIFSHYPHVVRTFNIKYVRLGNSLTHKKKRNITTCITDKIDLTCK